MALKRILTEFGTGSSLRRRDYTAAAERAIRDALWHNSIDPAGVFGLEKSDMIIRAVIGVQEPDAVDTARLAALFPYGDVTVTTQHGGMDVEKPDGSGSTIIANAAITVFLDLEPAE